MHSLKVALGFISRVIVKPTALRCMSTAPTQSFKYDDLEIKLATESELRAKPDPDSLVFGKEFSDHMLEIDWTEEGGWENPQITPLHNFSMHPAAKVYHYAVELFEGMKAYRGVDNKIRMFRPDANMERMISSAKRSSFPSFDGEELIKCLKKLVSVDQEWVPYSTTSTLYIRPTMIGTEPSLGVSKSMSAKLFVLTGPVGPYYPTGFKPVSLLADPKYVRAWEGGCGGYKMGSNYAPTIYIQIEALKKYGCQQVLWLYGKDHQLTEVGTMNLFVFWENERGEKELVTPPLSQGIILPGVTRKTLLELTRTWGEFKVSERIITMREITDALDSGRLKEMFGAGTACVVCPVSSIMYDGNNLDIPTMDEGAPLTMRLYKELTDMQFGRTKHEWAVEI